MKKNTKVKIILAVIFSIILVELPLVLNFKSYKTGRNYIEKKNDLHKEYGDIHVITLFPFEFEVTESKANYKYIIYSNNGFGVASVSMKKDLDGWKVVD